MDTKRTYNPEVLKGKVALITGGSNRGMISEIGKAYIAHGCKGVAFMARKAEKLQEVVQELNAACP